MRIMGQLQVLCDNYCFGNEFHITYNPEYMTKSDAIKYAKYEARRRGWRVTRENKFYCKECADKLKIRRSPR